MSIAVPEIFTPAPKLAEARAVELQKEVHLGGLRARVRVQAWHAASVPASLYLTWLVTPDPVELPDVAIHSELELLRATPERVTMSPEEVEITAWETGMSGDAASVIMRWRHLSFQTETRIRAIIFQTTAGKLYYVQAECLHQSQEDPGLAAEARPSAICDRILDSMVPAKEVGALRPPNKDALAQKTPPTPGQSTVDTAAAAATGSGPTASPSTGATPQLTDPGKQPMPAIVIARGEKQDYTKLLFILGGALLLVALYFTARSRSRAEEGAGEESEGEDEDGDEGGDGDDENGDEGESEGDEGESEGDEDESDDESESDEKEDQP